MMDDISNLAHRSWPWLSFAIALGAVAVAHTVIFWLLCRFLGGDKDWRRTFSKIRWPTFWLGLALTAGLVVRGAGPSAAVLRSWRAIGGLLLPALVGWLAIATLNAVYCWLQDSADISVADNLSARRRRTRLAILSRITTFVILFVTAAMMLLSFPAVRAVGITLVASAGIAAIVVGAAAQPAMKNLIAGAQLAFTEPIRIDDVVIIDGEWGRIEEIGLTYVVVALWDQRRLIVPVSKLLEDSFQNWTRRTSQLLGTAFLHLDPRADVARIRRKFLEVLASDEKWDRRVGAVQVTDMTADSIQVRLLVSAADAGKLFDLRCNMREAMIDFVQKSMPDALPHRRDLLSGEIEAQRKAA